MTTATQPPLVEEFAPVICAGEKVLEAKALLYEIGTTEMRWPKDEVAAMLDRTDSKFVGVTTGGILIGAGQILSSRPLPVEEFALGCIKDGKKPVEVSLVGLNREYRRQALGGDMSAFDALIKAVYWGCRQFDFTDIWALFEDTRIFVFNDIAQIPVEKKSDGKHYWCSRVVHSDDCPLTWSCRMNRAAGEASWAANRPKFYRYVMAGL